MITMESTTIELFTQEQLGQTGFGEYNVNNINAYEMEEVEQRNCYLNMYFKVNKLPLEVPKIMK